MSDDLIERLRQGPVRIIEHYTSCSAEEVDDVEDTMTEAADELSHLRAEVERLTAERDAADRRAGAMRKCAASESAKAASLRIALAAERRHADALAANVMAAAACLDLLPATAIACGADEKAIEIAKSAEDYDETMVGIDAALAQHRARRQG